MLTVSTNRAGQLGDLPLQPLGQRAHLVRLDPGEQRGKLVAAEPGGNVARADVVAQRIGHHTECPVALVMSVLVVDPLERVDVEQQSARSAAGWSAVSSTKRSSNARAFGRPVR